MHAGGPGKRRIKSFGTWKSSGFERKGEKETVSLYPPPHSGLLSLKSGRGRPLGLGSCPPKATRLGRGAGPGVKPPGWQKPGGDPEPPVGRSGHCISALITVSPQCYSVYSSSEGTPLSQRSPPPTLGLKTQVLSTWITHIAPPRGFPETLCSPLVPHGWAHPSCF